LTIREKENLPKGFICMTCSKEHRYPPSLFAHWTIEVNFRCECGTEYAILRGNAKRHSLV